MFFSFIIQGPLPHGQNPGDLEACEDVDDEEEVAPAEEELPEEGDDETTKAPRKHMPRKTTPKRKSPTTPAPEDGGDDNEDNAGDAAPEDNPQACVDKGN